MYKVSLELSPEDFEIVASALGEIEQINWTVEKTDDCFQLCGYFDGDYQADWENLQKAIPLLQNKSLNVCEVQEKDWANEYKKYLNPVKIGPLHIIPIWEKSTYSVPDREFGIYLDAEMAFGTGAHETTQLCLARIVEYRNLFEKELFAKHVIDVGCGSGILSIAAAKLGFPGVYGFDIDPDAITISEQNAKINQAPNITFKVADIKTGILGHQGDLIVANVLAPILIDHASILVNTVKKYGCLSLSGILASEMDKVRDVFDPLVKRYWDSFLSSKKVLRQWAEIAYIRM